MRISCVIGPFLPIPPKLGGAVERIFLALSMEFARRGHQVTIISRRFEGLANDEFVDGVRHLRLPSFDAPASSILYRLMDIVYALRVSFSLPASDVTITHSVFLPLVISRRRAGKIYVSVARFPKHQFHWYRRADRLQAVSTHIAKAICEQTPAVAHLVKAIPNTISDAFCKAIIEDRGIREKEVVFVGRIAKEKGIDILIRAFASIQSEFVDWRLVIVGPFEVSQGGDGRNWLLKLQQLTGGAGDRVEFVGPVFDEALLIDRFKRAEIFVYPSVAAKGEALPLAPLEAMACGCAVVVSNLDCFSDYLCSGKNGLQFDHTDVSGKSLAVELKKLMTFPELRSELAKEGIRTSQQFTPAPVAKRFLDDFESLTDVVRQ